MQLAQEAVVLLGSVDQHHEDIPVAVGNRLGWLTLEAVLPLDVILLEAEVAEHLVVLLAQLLSLLICACFQMIDQNIDDKGKWLNRGA